MKDALTLDIHGIKCDNPNCDFNNMDVSSSDYDKWVNKPCPKCGQNLLTEKDYRNTLFLMEITKIANKIYPQMEDDEPIASMKIEMNGTGDVKVGDINIIKGEEI